MGAQTPTPGGGTLANLLPLSRFIGQNLNQQPIQQLPSYMQIPSYGIPGSNPGLDTLNAQRLQNLNAGIAYLQHNPIVSHPIISGLIGAGLGGLLTHAIAPNVKGAGLIGGLEGAMLPQEYRAQKIGMTAEGINQANTNDMEMYKNIVPFASAAYNAPILTNAISQTGANAYNSAAQATTNTLNANSQPLPPAQPGPTTSRQPQPQGIPQMGATSPPLVNGQYQGQPGVIDTGSGVPTLQGSAQGGPPFAAQPDQVQPSPVNMQNLYPYLDPSILSSYMRAAGTAYDSGNKAGEEMGLKAPTVGPAVSKDVADTQKAYADAQKAANDAYQLAPGGPVEKERAATIAYHQALTKYESARATAYPGLVQSEINHNNAGTAHTTATTNILPTPQQAQQINQGKVTKMAGEAVKATQESVGKAAVSYGVGTIDKASKAVQWKDPNSLDAGQQVIQQSLKDQYNHAVRIQQNPPARKGGSYKTSRGTFSF